MPTTHIVKQGEHLSQIAQQHGFATFEPIWEHPDNAELKAARQFPHVLFPGDQVVIPDKDEKLESGATEQRHRFRFLEDTLILRLAVQDVVGDPISGEPCVLHVDLTRQELHTDGEGKIEVPITQNSKRGLLSIENLEMPLKIGHLDPITEQTGQKARLNNLGYFAGELDKPDENLFKSAVEEFQCDHDLFVDGNCGPDTQAKLSEVYGY